MTKQKVEYLQLTAGRGPDECALGVAKLMEAMRQDAQRLNLDVCFEHCQRGKQPNTYVSSVMRLSGLNLSTFKSAWVGSIKWECQSPFRPKHKRKTWYMSVNEYVDVDTIKSLELSDITIESMRASGPGGQHVNKTNSAVRLTHQPTGISVISQKFRCYHQNKKYAFETLNHKLNHLAALDHAQQIRASWQLHDQVKRGCPIKIFKGLDFQLVNR